MQGSLTLQLRPQTIDRARVGLSDFWWSRSGQVRVETVFSVDPLSNLKTSNQCPVSSLRARQNFCSFAAHLKKTKAVLGRPFSLQETNQTTPCFLNQASMRFQPSSAACLR
jgi:hypothetical protein